FELYGVDYSATNIKYASNRLKGKAVIQQGSIYQLPFENETFDVSLCLEVLEHIEDDSKAVKEISRVLKPGGILIAAVPYTYYWKSYKKRLGHFRHYTKESFSNLLKHNGFTSVVDYLPNYFNWHQKYTRRYAFIMAQYKLLNKFFRYNSVFE